MKLVGFRVAVAFLLGGIFLKGCANYPKVTENDFDSEVFSDFVEHDFPFFGTYVDARNIGESFPEENIVARGVSIRLTDSSHMCFDTDLLRWSVAWTGDQLPMVLLPQISNQELFNRKNDIPRINGQAEIANGMYPGWTIGAILHGEIRDSSQHRKGFFWGAIPPEYGRWEGVYTVKDKAVLSYSVGGTSIKELPEVIPFENDHAFVRTLEVKETGNTLYLNVAEVRGGTKSVAEKGFSYIYNGSSDTITVAYAGGDDHILYPVRAIENRYLSIEVPASTETRNLTVYLWRGPHTKLESFRTAIKNHIAQIPSVEKGVSKRWEETVYTKGRLSQDTGAFVTDLLTLPVPNPWKRNVRAADLAFISGRTAAVVTFSGDVWIVDGISDKLDKLSWKRYASGLFEPMSIQVYKGDIYVYGKEGIIRLHDLNGDGEADFYENFSNAMQQSTESREWATDMVIAPDGGFYIAKGGSVAGGPGMTPNVASGFRAGSNQSGTVVKISEDGRSAEMIASGLRVPYLGIHPGNGTLTASDQQGNFVPATPLYLVRKGDYFGVVANHHQINGGEITKPLSWIPYHVDRSASSQLWVTNGQMGPLNNSLLHISFGRPGAFKVLIDSTSQGVQGGVVYVKSDYSAPTIKGVMGPDDGQVYLVGLNLFGSNSKGVSAIHRLRYTGKPSYLLNSFKAGEQGVILCFDSPIREESALQAGNFSIKRWNYQRTAKYGSGHFSLDGASGEEGVPVIASHISPDKKKILLVIPDMRVVDQMEIKYKLKSQDGQEIDDEFWFTVNYLDELNPAAFGFPKIDFKRLFEEEKRTVRPKTLFPVSVERGEEIFIKSACIGCHSTETRTEGMYGPPFGGLYGTVRELQDGSSVKVDAGYIKESIINPDRKVAKGYNPEMPSFSGILSESDIESIVLYMESLAGSK